MAHSINSHHPESAVNRTETYALSTDVNPSASLRLLRSTPISLLRSHTEGIRERASQMLSKETSKDIEWELSPLLIDSGRLLISGSHRRQTRFDPNSIVAAKGTLGSLSIDKDGFWDYSVYNIKMQFLQHGERKIESFSLYSESGDPITISLTLIGVEGGAVIEELATEVTVG
ncbi:VCBS domain-containing protein [Vibrio sp. Isolate24]|uniref:VCBS domain-containing protein n=1 Tax=Vibrio sp. Isolate24 TaxID=2908534 RepID=UPI001EFD73D7|nr:VCBS domain-containing protein [Vibrio sp. Isolate24]MCG9680135.1 VCBS domain-containing protein [Vibrio sp. Isolate24]